MAGGSLGGPVSPETKTSPDTIGSIELMENPSPYRGDRSWRRARQQAI